VLLYMKFVEVSIYYERVCSYIQEPMCASASSYVYSVGHIPLNPISSTVFLKPAECLPHLSLSPTDADDYNYTYKNGATIEPTLKPSDRSLMRVTAWYFGESQSVAR